jgi:GNAT superfamily N-acetyltransferase
VKLEFKPFNASTHLPEQRELFRDCFPEAIGTGVEALDHYQWKFHSYPSAPASYEYAVWEPVASKLLGYYAAIPFRYSVSGSTLSCGMVCDVMTHSAARGQGIFTKIGRYATDDLQEQGIDFTSGYPIRPEVLPGHIKVGWQVAQELPMYLKVLRCDALLRNSLARYFTRFVNVGLRLACWATRPRLRRGEDVFIAIESATAFFERKDGAYERLFARWAASRPVHLIKDRDFLRWRLGAPGTEYHTISIKFGSEISAFAIVRDTILRGIPCLAVLDIMAPEGDRKATKLLIRTIEDLASNRSCEAIAVMISRRSAGKALLPRHGFIKTPFVFKLIIKPLSERVKRAKLLEAQAFDVMWIDSDDL